MFERDYVEEAGFEETWTEGEEGSQVSLTRIDEVEEGEVDEEVGGDEEEGEEK